MKLHHFPIDLQYNEWNFILFFSLLFISSSSAIIIRLFVLHLVEHALCMIVGVFRVSLCTNSTSFEGYFKQSWPQVYTIVKYDNGVRGIFSELLNYYCTFQWTFMDIFIISISICLSTRFNQLNEHLKQYKGMVNVQFDYKCKNHYNKKKYILKCTLIFPFCFFFSLFLFHF